jgi:hypothetical protein
MARSHRLLRWLRWVFLALALTFAGLSIWFVLRIERFILARLPREVVVGNLSVSFITSRFVLNDVQILGREAGACSGKVLATARQIEGDFLLRQRQLKSVTLADVRLTAEGIDRRCFAKDTHQSDFSLRQYTSAAGVIVDIRDAVMPLREVGAARLNAVATLVYPDEKTMSIKADRITLAAKNLNITGRNVSLALDRNSNGLQLQNAAASVTARYSDLSKLPRLSSRKLVVRAGEAELKLSAEFAQSAWSVFSAVELKGVKVGGAPLYNMPMGLLQLSPESLWSMAEDAPGLFAFSFKTLATTVKLPATYVADFRIALTNKVRKNLKKKIPVLPF